MKRSNILGALLLLAVAVAGALTAQSVTKVYFSNGGDTLTVASGGTLAIASGATWTVGGTTVSASGANLNGVRTGQEYQVGFGAAKAGTTAGWVVAAGANLYEWTLPASQTASTLVIPINGLHVGDTITGFNCDAQIESAGGAVTLDAELRSLTNAAADPTDASVGSVTQVSVTADTAASPSVGSLSDVVAQNERFYILVTGTTAGSTDVRMLGCTVTVTTS